MKARETIHSALAPSALAQLPAWFGLGGEAGSAAPAGFASVRGRNQPHLALYLRKAKEQRQCRSKLAAREHRVLSTEELYALGFDSPALTRAVRSGRLYRKHRGVYAVGHPRLTREGVWLAAVKACGEGAALSHQSAAQHSRMVSPETRGSFRSGSSFIAPHDPVAARFWGL
jgi:hypothetical protein